MVAKKQQKSLSLIKKIEKIAVSFGLHFRVRNEAQRCTVDTVADSIRGFRVVCKDMTEMGVARSAADFCASHSKRESFFSMIAGASIGFVKAGQPQLLSNLSEDEKRGSPVTIST